MSTQPPPRLPFPPPGGYTTPQGPEPPTVPSPPVAPAGSEAPTISAPPVQQQVQPAPPAAPVAATPPSRRHRGLIIAGCVAAAVVLVVVAIVTRPNSGKGEKIARSPSLTPVKTFTPATLHQAILSTPFPASLLPAGFSFDSQKSPQGKAYAAQGFSTPEKTQEHHSVGTAAVALSSNNPGQAFQITFLSFADPPSAEAYMQEARNAVGVQAPPGQPVCGAVSNGVIAGCSVQLENVVVEGRDKSTTGDALADTNAALATSNSLAQAGITYLHQIKGG